MAETQEKVIPEMTIDEIFSKFPHKAQRLAHEMTRIGLHCVGCGAATWETLEAGMLGHGMTQEDIEKLVGKLNAILAEESDPETINLTPRAAAKYREILEDEGKLGWGLRFSEQPAGCSGLEYVLDYSEKPDEDDDIFESNGVQVHVKKLMSDKLKGSEIDYIDGLQDAGFKISNPNVRHSCGCGNTHNY